MIAPSIPQIQRRTAEAFGITLAQLTGKRRTSTVALARQVAMHLARTFTLASSTEVGIAFGRDHSTVLHAEERIADLRAGAAWPYRAILEGLELELRGGKRWAPGMRVAA